MIKDIFQFVNLYVEMNIFQFAELYANFIIMATLVLFSIPAIIALHRNRKILAFICFFMGITLAPSLNASPIFVLCIWIIFCVWAIIPKSLKKGVVK